MVSDNQEPYDDEEGEDEDEFTKEFYRQQDEAFERQRKNWALYDEELKHEIWSCKVGDLLELIAPLDLWSKEADEPTIIKPAGQIYRVDELKGRCFYLELVSGPGEGSEEFGIWNADVPQFFKVLGPRPTK